MVPRLIVQPIIENAYEYGLKDTLSSGVLQVGFFESDGYLSIIVEDNGKGMSDEKLKELRKALVCEDDITETTALMNIHKRIQIMFGSDSGLDIKRSGLGGIKAAIRLRLQRPDEGV